MTVDPASRHFDQSDKVFLCGQHLGLEATHLAGGCRLTTDGTTADDLGHYGITR